MEWLAGLLAFLVCGLGGFVAFGPYQDERTWNLMRNTCHLVEVDVPTASPTHFRLLEVVPGRDVRNVQNTQAWRKKAPPVMFVPGHNGKWTQVINIADYVSSKVAASFFSLDFHASASAFHSAIVKHQAVFTAAAIRRLPQLYIDAGAAVPSVTVVAHSMGGVVALEALRLLRTVTIHGSTAVVDALILLSTPIQDHPLLLEPGMVPMYNRLRGELWTANHAPQSVAVAFGETDPLIPNELAALPPQAGGVSLLAPSMHNLHASFSHVNLLFSRHSLHALSKLVVAASQGGRRLLEVARSFRSPLCALLQRNGQLPGSVALSGGASSSVPRGPAKLK